ncbi:MAG: tetratricopeptide repeat protein [Pirellulaceae bacterium]|nr:tetratricopeptide repeat protein [Pirellulaceae bacterium]
MSTIQEILATAVKHHQAGQLADAERLYRQILDVNPDHADVLHFLGVIAAQTGKTDASVDLIRRAIRLAPGNAAYYFNLGKALESQGKLAEAVTSYKRALQIQPDFAEAHSNLGNVSRNMGKLDEAVASYQRAVRIKPDYAQAQYNLGIAFQAQEKFAEAVASYQRAVQIQPAYADALSNQGVALQRLGRLDEAVACLQRAVAIKPDHMESHNNLGNALQALGQLDEAVLSYRRALQIKPNYAKAHNNLGNVLEALGKRDEAASSYQEALQIQPNYAEAHNNLGNVLEAQGKLKEAMVAYERALQIQPDYAGAYANLAQARPYTSADKNEIERIETLLDSGSLTDPQRCHLHFALGKIYDDCQDWYRAFTHFREGNALVDVTYDNEQSVAEVDAIMTHCTPPLLQKGSELGDPSELPVLIVGMPRSGTTLVEQILATHPAVYGAGELLHIASIAKDLPQDVDPALGYPACLSKLNRPTARKFAETYLDQLRSESQSVIRVTDKMPSNFLHLGLVAMLLPNARIIHCRRHPLDVCLSCYYKNFITQTGLSYTFDLRNLGLYHRQYVRLMDHWRQVLPLRMLDVDYESLVDNQEEISRTLVEFCGLEWNPECLEFHKTERDVRTASVWQVRQPIFSTSVGRWKHYDECLGPLKDALGWSS